MGKRPIDLHFMNHFYSIAINYLNKYLVCKLFSRHKYSVFLFFVASFVIFFFCFAFLLSLFSFVLNEPELHVCWESMIDCAINMAQA